LHKIATACGMEELNQRGASDLINVPILDVFLLYSSRPESYVWRSIILFFFFFTFKYMFPFWSRKILLETSSHANESFIILISFIRLYFSSMSIIQKESQIGIYKQSIGKYFIILLYFFSWRKHKFVKRFHFKTTVVHFIYKK